MKLLYYISTLLVLSFLTGCYTQLETVQREAPRSTANYVAPSTGSAYDSFYQGSELDAYEDGYYDGYFDAQLGFRDYRYARTKSHIHFTLYRPFVGFGYSYSYYYDPYWHYASLYDPYFFAFYGYYRYPPHYRYRYGGFFHNPFWGPSNTFIVYNNYYYGGTTSGVRHTGPRSSGIHRGTVAQGVNPRDSRRNMGVAGRTDVHDLRTRNSVASDNLVRSRTNVGGNATAGSRVQVERSREAATREPNTRVRSETRSTTPPQRNVDRSRNRGSSGTARSTPPSRTNSRGTVNRGSSGSSQRATPPRRNTSNNRGTSGNNRERGNNESSISEAPVQMQQNTVRYTPQQATVSRGNRVVQTPSTVLNNRQSNNSTTLLNRQFRNNSSSNVSTNRPVNNTQPSVNSRSNVRNSQPAVRNSNPPSNNSAVNRTSSRNNSSSERKTSTRSRNN